MISAHQNNILNANAITTILKTDSILVVELPM